MTTDPIVPAAQPVRTPVTPLTLIVGVVFVVVAAGLVILPELLGFAQVATLVATPVAVVVLALICALIARPRAARG